MTEYWDIYTKDRQLTGQKMIRGQAFPEGACHLVVHVCIFNEQGQMLIQQRHKTKESWPEYWDLTVGGSALAGETAQEAAMREVKEEIGLSLDLSETMPAFTINFDNGFDDTFLVVENITIENITFPDNEVQDVKWASYNDITQMINQGIFIPYFDSKIRMCFEMREQYGIHKRRH
ncbi:NUDIX domain-containing protein [Streptococcus uberis]|nr:NUDIX domain-containing protein [Streptococcus uberis]